MAHFFQFEADFAESLRCIPMLVRMKLDTCGVKLKLTHWNQFTPEERQTLVTMACLTPEEIQAYRTFVQQLVTSKIGQPAGELPTEEHPPWLNHKVIPEMVLEKATEVNVTITPQQWENLTPLERFALIKLSRKSHENQNFYPALKEFKLI
ncbi:nitrate reductase associated protein [Aphanothece hegewaldii CCALA 016]|uniref:Nitrate reductase associated protein n=1 Tax=Aphanothece hegewaldii CCALA 016 TaxID=2107694 RepID=A0A2T1LWR0_9CHRO|nr:nitrate reductase associated protein [Aphanothece hegewaldii]PSF36595.1 nitrate reductase associated protein [Aphanothece hegewaldii CCALA 016]